MVPLLTAVNMPASTATPVPVVPTACCTEDEKLWGVGYAKPAEGGEEVEEEEAQSAGEEENGVEAGPRY